MSARVLGVIASAVLIACAWAVLRCRNEPASVPTSGDHGSGDAPVRCKIGRIGGPRGRGGDLRPGGAAPTAGSDTMPRRPRRSSRQTRDDDWAGPTESSFAGGSRACAAQSLSQTNCRQTRCRIFVIGSEHETVARSLTRAIAACMAMWRTPADRAREARRRHPRPPRVRLVSALQRARLTRFGFTTRDHIISMFNHQTPGGFGRCSPSERRTVRLRERVLSIS